MTNNHIGTAFEFVKQVAERCGWNYSHGNITERPFKKSTVFPLLHANISSVSVSGSVANVSLNVAIMDRVNMLKTENDGLTESTVYDKIGYTENQNYSHVMQEVYVRFMTALHYVKEDAYNEAYCNDPINFTAFIEAEEHVVAGYSLTLNLTVENPFVTDGRC